MTTTDQEIEASLRLAYMAAVKAGHENAGVAVHLGTEVVDYLRSFLRAVNTPTSGVPTIWGYPLVIEDGRSPRHVSVHTIVRIVG